MRAVEGQPIVAVRTAELGHAAALSGAGATIHTVAAGTTVIVKDWSVSNASSTAPALLFVERGTGTEWDLWRKDVASGTVEGPSVPRFHVLEPGDVLKMAGTSSMKCWVSGTILAGVA